ncbi:uncharacterized protein LOC118263341 isoform X2 [Spodoptera frugiperda]|uniref:Uncharacterized protein LOC118263341 isoform X2 n=1 Tax=Spodoptera frugiperda TaxID=7108 RepID=A0A9R0EGA6_SPOFR|nr:uncharacterized protein LOC118263341 isoform X2 [Spodoptera frugiperda]
MILSIIISHQSPARQVLRSKMCNINLLFTFLIIIALDYTVRVQGVRRFYKKGKETVLALEGEQFDMECKAEVRLTYCAFHHPSGKRFSVASATLKGGFCSMKVTTTKMDNGLWICHLGTHPSGLERVQPIEVRVVDQVAAVWKNISIVHNSIGTVNCATTKGMVPLTYCRFEPPNGPPFSINSDITRENAILGRYFFPKNKSLDRGDCAVTIIHARDEDIGQWTCGASLDDGKEYTDTVYVDVEASVAPYLFGVFGVLLGVVIIGVIVWRRQLCLGTIRPNEEGDAHELQALPGPSRARSLPRLTIESPTEPSTSSQVSHCSD